MGADGFLVGYEQLGDLGQQLADLRGEFNRGDDAIGPLLATISDGGLRAALKDFTDNWSHERQKLVEQLDRAAGYAVSAAACYRSADEGIARACSAPSGG